jgi:hypothetical protein
LYYCYTQKKSEVTWFCLLPEVQQSLFAAMIVYFPKPKLCELAAAFAADPLNPPPYPPWSNVCEEAAAFAAELLSPPPKPP